MNYLDNMALVSDETFNLKLLNALCKCAADLASSEGAPRRLAGQVARSPRSFSPAFAAMVASQGILTETSTDQAYYDAVASIWPVMSIADEVL